MDKIYDNPEIDALVRRYIVAPAQHPERWSDACGVPVRRTFLVYGRPGYALRRMIEHALQKHHVQHVQVLEYGKEKSLLVSDFTIFFTHAPSAPECDADIRVSCSTLLRAEDVHVYLRARFDQFAAHCAQHAPHITVAMEDDTYDMLVAMSTVCTHAELEAFCARVFYAALHSETEIVVDGALVLHPDNGFVYQPGKNLCITEYDTQEMQNRYVVDGGRQTTLQQPLKKRKLDSASVAGGGF